MAAPRLVRPLYTWASGAPLLRRPLDAVRSNPRVRAFARRHVGLLLARGTTWANVDGALRLLAEAQDRRIVFGPWRGDSVTELLYWVPFVRWAQEQFALDPAALAAVSDRGYWYGDACGAAGRLDELAPRFGGATVFPAEPVQALVEAYRSGSAAPRPLLKRARHEPLPVPLAGRPDGLPDAYVAAAVEPAAGRSSSAADRHVTRDLLAGLEARTSLVPLEGHDLATQHAVIAGARGLVASWSALALLGVLSGVPTIAVTPVDTAVSQTDLDLALRIASALGASFTVVDAPGLASLAAALAG
jgi:hypothetical protein